MHFLKFTKLMQNIVTNVDVFIKIVVQNNNQVYNSNNNMINFVVDNICIILFYRRV